MKYTFFIRAVHFVRLTEKFDKSLLHSGLEHWLSFTISVKWSDVRIGEWTAMLAAKRNSETFFARSEGVIINAGEEVIF